MWDLSIFSQPTSQRIFSINDYDNLNKAIEALYRKNTTKLIDFLKIPHIFFLQTWHEKRTLLHHAVLLENIEVIKLILSKTLPYIPQIKDAYEKSAIDLAEDKGRFDIVELIIPYFFYRKPSNHQDNSIEFSYFLSILKHFYLDALPIEPTQIPASQWGIVRKNIDAAIENLNFSADLWDDIFDNNDIFRPIYGNNEEANIEYYFPNMQSFFNTDADCRDFIKDRIKLFRFYVFLRSVVIIYRDPRTDMPVRNQCDSIIKFIIHSQNDDWFKRKLRVMAFAETGENWKSGLHEWLACSLTSTAIMRAAGLTLEVEPCLNECKWAWIESDGTEQDYPLPEFNWLDLQFLLRTPTKYMMFSHLQSGHVRSVNQREIPPAGRGNPGFLTRGNKGEFGLEATLETILNESTNIKDFVRRVYEKYKIDIFHDYTIINPTPNQNFLVDGTPTNDFNRLFTFQKKYLAEPHRSLRRSCADIMIHHHIDHSPVLDNTANNSSFAIQANAGNTVAPAPTTTAAPQPSSTSCTTKKRI